mmetsp:Transcript_127192/g.406674  ORF Transcript_127192/g.406674 Transcript_127192/m.406674 type:complete len:232 (-) Transcript_127192:542-1237(-)
MAPLNSLKARLFDCPSVALSCSPRQTRNYRRSASDVARPRQSCEAQRGHVQAETCAGGQKKLHQGIVSSTHGQAESCLTLVRLMVHLCAAVDQQRHDADLIHLLLCYKILTVRRRVDVACSQQSRPRRANRLGHPRAARTAEDPHISQPASTASSTPRSAGWARLSDLKAAPPPSCCPDQRRASGRSRARAPLHSDPARPPAHRLPSRAPRRSVPSHHRRHPLLCRILTPL